MKENPFKVDDKPSQKPTNPFGSGAKTSPFGSSGFSNPFGKSNFSNPFKTAVPNKTGGTSIFGGKPVPFSNPFSQKTGDKSQENMPAWMRPKETDKKPVENKTEDSYEDDIKVPDVHLEKVEPPTEVKKSGNKIY